MSRENVQGKCPGKMSRENVQGNVGEMSYGKCPGKMLKEMSGRKMSGYHS